MDFCEIAIGKMRFKLVKNQSELMKKRGKAKNIYVRIIFQKFP
jgi:hypothetical protein